MPNVTIVNGTNSLINVSISAGVNYDWRNQLPPKAYTRLGNTAVWVTVNARWWVGETTEYANSIAEIALFATGTVIGIVGLVLAIPSGGTSLALTIAGASVALGGAGLAVGGISLAIRDFANTPTSKTGVYLPDERKFIVEGALTFSYDRNQVATITGADGLRLRELTNDEFLNGIQTQGWVEARKDANETQHVGELYQSTLPVDVLGREVWIYPSFCGVPDLSPARWGLATDFDRRTMTIGNENEPVKLWRDRNVVWRILYRGQALVYNPKKTDRDSNYTAAAFEISNPNTGRCVCVSADEKDMQLRTKGSSYSDKYCLFFIIKSANCYAFVPISRQYRQSNSIHLSALINEGGGVGEGTAVLVGDRSGPTPGRARWVVEPLSLTLNPYVTPEELSQLSGDAPVRIFPAIARRHTLDRGERPVCWEIENDSPSEGASIQLRGRNTKMVEWVIKCEWKSAIDPSEGAYYSFFCPALGRYATVSADGYLRATTTLHGNSSQFLIIRDALGFLIFFPRNDSNSRYTGAREKVLYAERTTDGAKLRVGEGHNENHPTRGMRTLARWQVISTTSEVARAESWSR
jgi:hypothetical protein